MKIGDFQRILEIITKRVSDDGLGYLQISTKHILSTIRDIMRVPKHMNKDIGIREQ